MSDTPGPASSDDSSSRPARDRDWYAQQWRRLCDEVDATDPDEALARVQALKREANRASAEDADNEGLVTVSEVEEVFREMNQKVEKLRERNAALAERLEGDDSDLEGPFRDLHQKAEQLLDTLDAATMDEARTRIQKLNERLDTLYREKEKLAQAGLSDAEGALAELDRLRKERDAFQQERDRLQANLDRLEQTLENTDVDSDDPDPSTLKAASLLREAVGASTPEQAQSFVRLIDRVHEQVRDRAAAHGTDAGEAPDTGAETLQSISSYLDTLPAPGDHAPTAEEAALPPEVGEILGIRTPDDARELESLIADLSARLDRLSQELNALDEADLSADAAVSMIENMEAQLVDLYHNTAGSLGAPDASPDGLDDGLRRRALALTEADAGTLDTPTAIVRRLTNRLEHLAEEQQVLDEAGLDANEAVTMIESMNVQLKDLYRAQDEKADAAKRLAAIEDVLGISTREEAEELSEIARQMEDQLTAVYQEKEKLERLGLASIEDAVEMIENMDNQLAELYEDKEALQEVRIDGSADQSTFQQLEALYAERERLQQALGVSSATDVIELVESLTTQINELYKGRDADLDPDERHDSLLWEPDAGDSGSSADEQAAPTPDTSLTLSSMEHQLESLYREKEVLLHHGLSNAEEAVAQLQSQQKQLRILQRENRAYQQRFERLESKLGVANVSQVVALVQALQSEADVSLDEVRPAPNADGTAGYGLDIEAASPFVDTETLDRLNDMTADELNSLSVGAVRLDDDGVVEMLNEAALQLPGLADVQDRSAVIGQNFFLELAPSTNNDLFHGRFQRGKRRGTLDARFPYTFTSPDDADAHPFEVHLYRPPNSTSTWLLYQPT
jgi:photoactive yellow protein